MIGGNVVSNFVWSCVCLLIEIFEFFRYCKDGVRIAISGQAGLSAEFKYINKRRKRNLSGFF